MEKPYVIGESLSVFKMPHELTSKHISVRDRKSIAPEHNIFDR